MSHSGTRQNLGKAEMMAKKLIRVKLRALSSVVCCTPANATAMLLCLKMANLHLI